MAAINRILMEDAYRAEQKPNYSGFVVIGAGLPRTGTMSMRAALGQLLDGKCHHMLSVVNNSKDECKFWIKAAEGQVSDEEWKQFLGERGFRAGVDFPISWFYKELMRVFPEAKVVLTVRDPRRWYQSVKGTIKAGYDLTERSLLPNLFYRLMADGNVNKVSFGLALRRPEGFNHGLLQAIEEGEEATVDYFNSWVERVKATVPKERLLVFEVKEGWDPLCDFLGLPVPDTPFPRINDTASIQAILRRLWWASHIFFLGVVPGITAFAWAAYKGYIFG